MPIMVALVGDQPLPNFLPVRYYQPDTVLLVYSAKTEQMFSYLQATLQKETTVFGLKTDPYDILAIVRTLNEELDRLFFPATQSLIFNLTGGTKTMSMAAYQVAQLRGADMMYLQSEGKNTRVYHYTWAGQQLQTTGTELMAECIKLTDVFNLYFGPANWQECGASPGDGGPFEELISGILRAQHYEVMLGVKAFEKQIDIDVAVRFNNQYGVIEAKMGGKGRKLDGVKQLSTIARLLGTYSRSFYVITVAPNTKHKTLTDTTNIEVISLPSYNAALNVISQSDEAKLLTRIEKTLKG